MRRLSFRTLVLALSCAFAAVSADAQTWTYDSVYSIPLSASYGFLGGNLIQASDGNFWGITETGQIFKLTPAGEFTAIAQTPDPESNYGPGFSLTEGPDGNFYGITVGNEGGVYGYGTVFQVTPAGAYKVIYSFCPKGSCGNSDSPQTSLTLGSDGYLYGMTVNGTVYKVSTAGDYLVVNTTTTSSYYPTAPLVQAMDGNFYGIGQRGSASGTPDNGAIFKMTPGGAVTNLYDFAANLGPGSSPDPTGLTVGSDGYLYGTTTQGGNSGTCIGTNTDDGCGTLFKISTAGSFTQLEAFPLNSKQGADPTFPPFAASDGTLYGAVPAVSGAQNSATNLAYSLSNSGTYTIVNTQTGAEVVGFPTSMMQGADGKLYGTLLATDNGSGSIYTLTASPALPAPVQLSFANSTVGAGTAVTLSWQVLNAFSLTLQQCYAYAPSGAGTWTGKQTGSYSASTKLFTGSASITPTAAGIYTYALTCGGMESGFATLTVTASTKLSSTTMLTVTPSSPSVGQQATLKATVGGSGATPTGSVSFVADGTVLHTSTLSGGMASFVASTNGLTPGSYSLTASYGGDSTYNSSKSSVDVVTLSKAGTATALTVSPTSLTPPATATLTATVTRSVSGAMGTPTGSVTFYADGSHVLSTVKLVNGVATLTASSSGIAAGKYNITAKYLGDGGDAGSTSAVVVATVQ